VARAREANVSMIRLTHSICTALRGESYTHTQINKITDYMSGFIYSFFCILSFNSLCSVRIFVNVFERRKNICFLLEYILKCNSFL